MRLTDLLNYDPAEKKHGELQKGLKEFHFVLKAAALAIANLQQGNLEKFDSLVGENACQIRAVKIALIASKDMMGYDTLNQQIENAIEVVESLLLPETINSLMREGHSLREMLDLYGIDIPLCSEQVFVITSFILSEMKESNDPAHNVFLSITNSERSVPNKLHIENTHVSSSFKGRLASRLRRVLAEASVKFVQKAADQLQDADLLKMVTDHGAEHNSWPCVPMFWTYKTLLSLAKDHQLPLVLHAKFLDKVEEGFRVAKEEFLYFKPCEVTQKYVEFTPNDASADLSACVIEGVVCQADNQPFSTICQWKEKIMQHSIVDIVLAGAAHHRQYPNPDQTVDVVDEEFEHYKKLAENGGFSLCNPTTFFIKHVYSSLVSTKNRQFQIA